MAQYRNGNFPMAVGNVFSDGPDAVAARCLERISGMHRKVKPYAVQMDRWGRVVIDRIGDIVPDEWIMTCTRMTPVEDLVEELKAEASHHGARRAAPPVQHAA